MSIYGGSYYTNDTAREASVVRITTEEATIQTTRRGKREFLEQPPTHHELEKEYVAQTLRFHIESFSICTTLLPVTVDDL
jgi:hypothetical protein